MKSKIFIVFVCFPTLKMQSFIFVSFTTKSDLSPPVFDKIFFSIVFSTHKPSMIQVTIFKIIVVQHFSDPDTLYDLI